MNILHILDHSLPLFSGYSFRSSSIVRFQRSLGLRPVVLTSPKQGSARDEREEFDGIPHYRTGALAQRAGVRLPFAEEIRLMNRLARRIAEIVRMEKIDFIHSHSPLLNGFPALWVARKFKLPFVYEARAFWEDAAVDHGTFREKSFRYRLIRRLETYLFTKADRVITICDGMREELISRGVAASKVQVVPNGVDAEWFQPQPRATRLVEQFGLNGKAVFGFIGSFYHYEGLRFLLTALPKLLRELPGMGLLLVGGGAEEPELKKIAAGLDRKVVFAGQVPHASIRDFYSLIDVLVYPRRRMRLTELVTPLKPLEAMAMGKPVLASDVGGNRELIQHEKTGLLFSAESEEDFVAQAVRVGRDPEFRAALGTAARNHVIRERTWEEIIPRYLKLYTELRGTADRWDEPFGSAQDRP